MIKKIEALAVLKMCISSNSWVTFKTIPLYPELSRGGRGQVAQRH